MKKLIAVVALFLSVSALHAQNYYPVSDYGLRTGTTRIDLYGGMVLPPSSWSHNNEKVDLGDIGWSAGLGFYRNLSPIIALGLDGNYAQFGDGEKINPGTPAEYFYRTGAATGLVAARFYFFPRHSTRLYIPAGVGVGHIFARQKFTDGSHKTYNSTELAGMLGAGLEFDIDEDIIFGLEGRYYMLRTRDDFKTAFGKGHIHYTEVLLKFGFKF